MCSSFQAMAVAHEADMAKKREEWARPSRTFSANEFLTYANMCSHALSGTLLSARLRYPLKQLPCQFFQCVCTRVTVCTCGRRAKTTIRTASAFSKTESTNEERPLFARVSEITVVPEWDKNKVINRTRSGSVGLAHQVRRLCDNSRQTKFSPLESLTSIVR